LTTVGRFLAVGLLQNGLNICLFALLRSLSFGYLGAAVVAGVVALGASFGMHGSWTFAKRTSQRPLRMSGVRYLIAFASATAVGAAILAALVELARVPPTVAQTVAVLLVAPVSFIVQSKWVFGGH
jgi:putative flippase GtrA